MSEKISLQCPVTFREFECRKEEGVPYVTKGAKNGTPQSIYFSPYSEVGIAYPQLSDKQVNEIYEQGRYWETPKGQLFSPKINPGLYAMAEARWLTIEPFLEGAFRSDGISVLDVGGGHGYFGMSIVHTGKMPLRRYAVAEMDASFRQVLSKTWQLHFPGVSFLVEDRIEKFDEQFNLIVLSHILEHLTNPRDMLQEALQRMSPQGYMFIDVPHQDYRFKKDVFPHLLFYNASSLRQLAESVGLKVIFAECYGKDMKRSPMNGENERDLSVLMSKVIYKTRYFWPTGILKRFYSGYFGAKEKNVNGTWVRLLAQKKG